jgi:hypothetical protein
MLVQPYSEPPPALPPMMAAPRKLSRGVSGRTVILIAGIAIGILLFVGQLALQAAYLIPPPGPTPPSDYANTIRALGWTSVIAMDLAVALTVMIAWVVGVTTAEVSDGARRGIFIFATVFLAIWLLVGTIPISFFGRIP